MYSYKVMLKPNNKQMTRIRRTANMVIICQQLVFDYLNSFLERKEKYLHVKIHVNGLLKGRDNTMKK